ncbi:nitrite reductase small subunit NirD [Halomonas aquamarina]|uniref:Nitrite reductase small subunit NirD n=1 Tax=Vreelandella aquamarina TaxID=77097 RepID=A0ACC5VT66_9GAMM|nr:nitrite reductase small subunit NirD [Halomonas aquamarina]MBZ5487342.1 nitrite reductase small subunit NirD [Halomonas aquamarina]
MTATAMKHSSFTHEGQQASQKLCRKADLVAFSGVAAWLETPKGPRQIALFYLPGYPRELYAIDHHDPFSNANVIAHGIVGDIKGAAVVASPLYKQHFRLEDGQCVEDDSVTLCTWRAEFKGDAVWIVG